MQITDLFPGRSPGRGVRAEDRRRPEEPNSAGTLQAEIERAYRRFWKMVVPLPLATMGLGEELLDSAAEGEIRVDVEDTGDEIRVEAEVPGFREGDLDVRIGPDGLTIMGDRRREDETRGARTLVQERQFGHFERHIPLPPEVQPDGATARLSDGLLTVIIPKKAELMAGARRVPLRAA